ncbi:MAG: hypothetical protein GXP62_20190 [Oligoflexia bacterium]|nr:hypothetical protein [Oligoflexia bacterium]
MPFTPIRLLILIDDARGYCSRVVPRMKELLEQRAFAVDVHRIQDGPVDIAPYRGLVIGSPAFGLGIKGAGPTPELTAFIQALEDLDEKKVALFCVYQLRPGTTFDRMKGLVLELGADFVASHAYSLLRPHDMEHVIPAECMVRIR